MLEMRRCNKLSDWPKRAALGNYLIFQPIALRVLLIAFSVLLIAYRVGSEGQNHCAPQAQVNIVYAYRSCVSLWLTTIRYAYRRPNKAKQNNTLVSGIPPTLAKWGRPWYFLCKKKIKKKIKKKNNIFFMQKK